MAHNFKSSNNFFLEEIEWHNLGDNFVLAFLFVKINLFEKGIKFRCQKYQVERWALFWIFFISVFVSFHSYLNEKKVYQVYKPIRKIVWRKKLRVGSKKIHIFDETVLKLWKKNVNADIVKEQNILWLIFQIRFVLGEINSFHGLNCIQFSIKRSYLIGHAIFLWQYV